MTVPERAWKKENNNITNVNRVEPEDLFEEKARN